MKIITLLILITGPTLGIGQTTLFSYSQQGNIVSKDIQEVNILAGNLHYTQSACNDNGTSWDPSDDWFTFTMNPGQGLIVTGSYSSTGDFTDTNIPYGTPFTFDNNGAGILIANGPYNFTLVDDGDNYCDRVLYLPAPATCSPDICPPNHTGANQLVGIQSVNADYETDGIIDSDQIINSNAVVDYDSNTEINLLPGFETVIGVMFHAFIDGCGNLLKDEEEESKNK